jgi:hypothetical protein
VSGNRPAPDTYNEVIHGPARGAADRWERRRWWSRVLGVAIAFLVGVALVQLAARSGLPVATSLESAPPAVLDPAGLLLGGAIFWLGRDHWPLRPASRYLDRCIDWLVR